MDKLIVKVIKAKKGLDPLYSIRGFLVADNFYFFNINFNFFIVIINLRYFIYFTLNLYFLILTYKPAFYNLFKTFLI